MRPSSCEVERYFSRAGYLLSPLRSRLASALVSDILFLSANLDLLANTQPFVKKLLARRARRDLAREARARPTGPLAWQALAVPILPHYRVPYRRRRYPQARARALGALDTFDMHDIDLNVYQFEDVDSAVDDPDFAAFVNKFCPPEQGAPPEQQQELLLSQQSATGGDAGGGAGTR